MEIKKIHEQWHVHDTINQLINLKCMYFYILTTLFNYDVHVFINKYLTSNILSFQLNTVARNLDQ